MTIATTIAVAIITISYVLFTIIIVTISYVLFTIIIVTITITIAITTD